MTLISRPGAGRKETMIDSDWVWRAMAVAGGLILIICSGGLLLEWMGLI